MCLPEVEESDASDMSNMSENNKMLLSKGADIFIEKKLEVIKISGSKSKVIVESNTNSVLQALEKMLVLKERIS